MKTTETIMRRQLYCSDVLTDVRTDNPKLGGVITWADAHPQVWKIVSTRKSKAFGLGSCTYIGWAQRSMEPNAILERVRHLKELADRPGRWGYANSIHAWAAQFTLNHFYHIGFTGGFFQQHDANYPRSCMTLDFTPETFEEVLAKFCLWMDRYFDTRRVTLNGRTVLHIAEQKPIRTSGLHPMHYSGELRNG